MRDDQIILNVEGLGANNIIKINENLSINNIIAALVQESYKNLKPYIIINY